MDEKGDWAKKIKTGDTFDDNDGYR